jgi:hypothetical protein
MELSVEHIAWRLAEFYTELVSASSEQHLLAVERFDVQERFRA